MINKILNAITRQIPESGDLPWPGMTQVVADVCDMLSLTALIGGKAIPLADSSSSTLSAGGTLTRSTFLHKVKGNGGAVTLSATSAIADGTRTEELLLLTGDDATNTVTIQDGANTKLRGDIVLNQFETILLRWNGADWEEVSRSNPRTQNPLGFELQEARANGRNKITFRAPSSLAADLTFTLPSVNAVGTLANDGAGTLSWQSGASVEFNIGAYGAIGDDSTDNTTAIVAAYNAIPSTGGILRIPRGIFRMQYSALFVFKSKVSILFDPGGVLKGIAATNPGPLINVGDATHPVEGFMIRDGEINGNAAACTLTANASGHCVSLFNVKRAWISNIYLHDVPGDAVRFDYGSEANLNSEVWVYRNDIKTCYRNCVSVMGHRIFIDKNIFDGYNTVGVDIEPDNTGESSKYIQVQGNFFYPNATYLNSNNTNRQDAIQAFGPAAQDFTSEVIIADNFIFGLTDTAIQYPRTGIKIQNYRRFSVGRNHVFQVGVGINCASGSSDSGSSGGVNENHVYGCADMGINVLFSTVVGSNVSEFNGGAGIYCVHTRNTLQNNICRNNGQNAALAYRYGIWLGDGEQTLVGNECYDNQGSKTQQYGLRLDSTVSKCRIALNDFAGNAVDGVSDGSGARNDIFLNRGAASKIENAEFTFDALRIYQGVLGVNCLKLEPASDTAKGMVINKAGVGAGALIELTNSGTGKDILGNASNWSVAKDGALIALSAALSTLAVSGAATVGSLASGAITGSTGDFSGDIKASGGFRTLLNFHHNVPSDGSAHDFFFVVGGTSDGDMRNKAAMIRPGSITGIALRTSSARTAGTLTATAVIDGTPTTLATQLNGTNTTNNETNAAKDAIPFSQGSVLTVNIQISGFTPTGPDIICTLEIET